jgi:hypothetical protein
MTRKGEIDCAQQHGSNMGDPFRSPCPSRPLDGRNMGDRMSREDLIWAAWDERGIYAWKAETHGRGLEPLVIQGPPLSPHEVLEFRLEFANESGRPTTRSCAKASSSKGSELP